MAAQSYRSHARWVPLYHGVLTTLLLSGLLGSVVNLYQSWGDHQRLYSASLIVVLFVALTMTAFFARFFALKAQDRVIRIEENFRHFVMTGKPLDPRITVKQTIGLRFASDGEFVALAKEAAESGLSMDEIKQRVNEWRPDFDRA